MTATSAQSGRPSSVAEVRERVRDALSHSRRLRIVGGATWLDANRPVQADDTLVMRDVSGIVEYEPGDLTITLRAGTTLDEIAQATAAHGQWLTLDPPGDAARATIGATLATGSYGPLSHHFGTPRDIALGVEFVTGAGEIVRGGGRVVKNVAGFDLTRLTVGAWGSLGVLTEVTVRLRALPAVRATLGIDASGADQLERVRRELHQLPFVPLAAQLIDGTLAGRLSVSEAQTTVLVRLGGNEDAVRAQREQLRAVGGARELDEDIWRHLRSVEPARAAVLRLSRRPSEFVSCWREASEIAQAWPGGYSSGDPGRGVVRVVLPLGEAASDSALQSALASREATTRIYERLPPPLWNALARSAIHNRLDRDVKRTFDPRNLLNPGILGELQ